MSGSRSSGRLRLYALWRWPEQAACERGELLGLAWRSLDLDAATLTVDRQLIPAEHGCQFGPPKSRRSRRTIALDAATATALNEHRQAQLVERALAGDA
jgi:integrase